VISLARRDPRSPHQDPARDEEFSPITWGTGFITSLLLPLIILLAAHGVLRIPLEHSQGIVIFLFFSWVTSSQAIMTLYRLRAVGSWKVAGIMLLMLLLVVSTYLLAAERFTHFLYPDPGEVAGYFAAAALPVRLFDTLVAGTALMIVLGWVFIYARSHGRTLWGETGMPAWIGGIQARLYLFFMNRLYLDGLALRLTRSFRNGAERLDRSRYFFPACALAAVAAAFPQAAGADLRPSGIPLFLLAVLLLPLFPLQGVYIRGMTARLADPAGRYLPIALAFLFPPAGLYAMAGILPGLPPEVLDGIGVLALAGAVYGSVRALVQVRAASLIAYGSLALYSILWWYLASSGKVSPPAVLYVSAAALATGGLLLAWDRLRVRYGDLDLSRIGGLAGPMPRLGTLLALLVMAAAGLPPFGLFSGFLALLLGLSETPAFSPSAGLLLSLLAWFLASWYLFRMMQQLLFGMHRRDLPYKDLRPLEMVPLAAVLFLLLALGLVPGGWIAPEGMETALDQMTRVVMEATWNR
jgi:hypothetical protein